MTAAMSALLSRASRPPFPKASWYTSGAAEEERVAVAALARSWALFSEREYTAFRTGVPPCVRAASAGRWAGQRSLVGYLTGLGFGGAHRLLRIDLRRGWLFHYQRWTTLSMTDLVTSVFIARRSDPLVLPPRNQKDGIITKSPSGSEK